MIELKQISDSPMMSIPRKTVTTLSTRTRRIEGIASTISETQPARTIGLRPTRSDSLPKTGISSRQISMTMISRILAVRLVISKPSCRLPTSSK